MRLHTSKKWKVDFLPRFGSFWIGVHYSSNYQSYCIAIIPCLVIRIGKTDYVKDPALSLLKVLTLPKEVNNGSKTNRSS